MSDEADRIYELRRQGTSAPRCPSRVRARASALLREQRERSLGARLRALTTELLPATRGEPSGGLLRLAGDDLNVDLRIARTATGDTRLDVVVEPLPEGATLLLETPPAVRPWRVDLDGHGTGSHTLGAAVRECIVIVRRPGAPALRSERIPLRRD